MTAFMIQKAIRRLPHRKAEWGAALHAVHSACPFFRFLRDTRSTSLRRLLHSFQNSSVLFFTAFSSSQCSYASVPSSSFSHFPDSPSHSFTSDDENIALSDELKEEKTMRRDTPFQSGSTSTSSSLIYRVPVLASRLVGRQKELLFLWQQLLRGKHTFIVTGVDGVGKSAFCAEFCDRARRSNRFSCVHWLSICNGESAGLKEKLRKLFSSMTGRRELDVLLVLNNIPSQEMEATLAVLPTHSQVYFLLNTTGEVYRDGALVEQVNSPVPADKDIKKNEDVEQLSDAKRKRREPSLVLPYSESSPSMSFLPSRPLKVRIDEGSEKEEKMLNIGKFTVHPGEREKPVILPLGPLLPEEANCFHAHLSPFKETTDDKALEEVFQYCACVPLLLTVALPLLEEKCFNSAGEMLAYLTAEDDSAFPHNNIVTTSLGDKMTEIVGVREVSVSKQLSVLLRKSLEMMERQWPNARKQLTLLAFLNAEDLSESFVSLLFATEMSLTPSKTCNKGPHALKMTKSTPHFDGALGVALAVKFGILSPKWSASGGYRMHSSIAAVLRQEYSEAGEEKLLSLFSSAVEHVAMMWPKRWRGLKYEEGCSLVRHSSALLLHMKRLLSFSESQPPAQFVPPRVIAVSPSLVYVFDKSAQFLAYYARENLSLAGDMWYAVFSYYALVFSPSGSSPSVSSTFPPSHFSHLIDMREAVRIGIDCGRMLHYLNDDRAYQVLDTIRRWCLNVHGELSLEYGLVLSYLAPYLSATSKNLDFLDKGIAALEYALSSEASSVSEEVLSAEELKMFGEALFVLLLRKGQTLQETGYEVPNALWERLLEVEQEIKKFSRKQSE